MPGAYGEDYVRQLKSPNYIPTDDPDFVARFAKWPHFKRRNIGTLLKEQLERNPDLEVWINATVTDFDLNRENGRLQSRRWT